MRLKILILVLLLCSPVAAQQYGLSDRLDSLRAYVYDGANLSSSGSRAWDSTRVNRVINKKIQKVCAEYDAIGKLDTVTVSTDSTGVGLNSDFLRLKNVFYMSGTDYWIPIKVVPDSDSLRGQNPGGKDNIADPSTPEDIKTCRVHGDRLLFHPKWTSDNSGSYLVEYWACDSLLNANASVTQVHQEYRQLIIDLTVQEILGK